MVSFSVLVVVVVLFKGEMLVKLMQQTLMLLSGPRRKLLESRESEQIVENLQPEVIMVDTAKAFVVQEVAKESGVRQDTGFPEPLSPGECC